MNDDFVIEIMGKVISTIVLAFALAVHAQSQSVSVSPTSIILWGQTPKTALVDFKYKNVTVLFIAPLETRYKDTKGNKYAGLFTGVFYSPLNLNLKNISIAGGGGAIIPKFPTKNGANLNFRFQIAYRFRKVSLEYSHISNGAEILGFKGRTNVGLDNIALRFHF